MKKIGDRLRILQAEALSKSIDGASFLSVVPEIAKRLEEGAKTGLSSYTIVATDINITVVAKDDETGRIWHINDACDIHELLRCVMKRMHNIDYTAEVIDDVVHMHFSWK